MTQLSPFLCDNSGINAKLKLHNKSQFYIISFEVFKIIFASHNMLGLVEQILRIIKHRYSMLCKLENHDNIPGSTWNILSTTKSQSKLFGNCLQNSRYFMLQNWGLKWLSLSLPFCTWSDYFLTFSFYICPKCENPRINNIDDDVFNI